MTAAASTAATAAVAASNVSSSYLVKFKREQFLKLVGMANPRTIYHSGRIHFFSFDGFVMYTSECEDKDFKQKVPNATEFSNRPWDE